MNATKPEPPSIASPPIVVERDDGKFAIGFHDDADGPFQSRRHAEEVLRLGTRHHDLWVGQ
jgi:hypothetical protein